MKRFNDEHGAVLPLVGFMLALLLGVAAFATDLGWFYLTANRAQKAADAAALAGVIYMPDGFSTSATTAAVGVASSNGFVDGADGVHVTVSRVTDEHGADLPHELEVSVDVEVPTFFLRVFGKDTQEITRSSTAQYLPPLPMGSPGSTFGNDPNSDTWVGFWANIHGTYTDTRMGDAFSSWCPDGSGSGYGCAGTSNPSYRDTGYVYAVDVPEGTSKFTVYAMDLALHQQTGDFDHKRTGDGNDCNGCTGMGQTVIATVYYPDPTPLDLSDNIPVENCTVIKHPEGPEDEHAAYVWEPICNLVDPAAGIYPLQIRVDTPKIQDDTGLNRYSLKVSGVGETPRLYAIGDMSIFNNISGSTSDFYLAQVDTSYHGKTFVVELYDPGDAASNVSNIISFLGPDGSTWTDGCTISTRDEVTQAWSSLLSHSAGDPCTIDATRPAHDYNGQWLQVKFQLPGDYVGGWWKVHYDYSGTTQDTTTWRAYMLGNPIHLVLGK